MAKAEGLRLPFKQPCANQKDILETFPYEGPRQRITYATREFSAVCPFSGLPDLGTVQIVYIPGRLCVELKSLKYYFITYRDVGIYQEDVTAKIYSDLFELLSPQLLELTVTYQIRGGIDTTCSIASSDQEKKASLI